MMKHKTQKPTKAEVNRLSEHYRNMILSHKEVELITKEDYNNLLDVAKYAELGRSTAIQSAFYLGYLTGKANTGSISKNDMLDEVFTATCKLELIQTVLGTLINMVEKEEIKTPEQAMNFAINQNVIGDFLHIALDGVCYAIQTLDGLQKGGGVE